MTPFPSPQALLHVQQRRYSVSQLEGLRVPHLPDDLACPLCPSVAEVRVRTRKGSGPWLGSRLNKTAKKWPETREPSLGSGGLSNRCFHTWYTNEPCHFLPLAHQSTYTVSLRLDSKGHISLGRRTLPWSTRVWPKQSKQEASTSSQSSGPHSCQAQPSTWQTLTAAGPCACCATPPGQPWPRSARPALRSVV